MRKLISMNERYIELLKKEAEELGVTESDFIRRLLDKYVEDKKNVSRSKI